MFSDLSTVATSEASRNMMAEILIQTILISGDQEHTRVAVVQAEPVYFDLDGATQKAILFIEKAVDRGAQLVAFPEVWNPSYPSWI